MNHNTELSVREMRANDYDSLIGLWEATGLKHHPEGRDSRERIVKELGTPMAIFLVAEAEGTIVGSLLGTTDGRKGWINRLAVHPKWQRRGVAIELLEEMERRFDERGILVVCALIQGDNAPSRAFFAKAGYEEDLSVVYYSKRKNREV